jgi:hypothetical protein
MTTSPEKKNRPTPKRKDSEAKRAVSSLAPTTNKESKKRDRDAARARRAASRIAYMRGDESALPARDRGPARRFVRNYVDSKRSVGEYFIPLIFVVLILSLFPVPAVQIVAIAFMYSALVASGINGFLLSRKIRAEVTTRFPGTSTKGLGMYGWLRSTQMRRLRAPAPQKKLGEQI